MGNEVGLIYVSIKTWLDIMEEFPSPMGNEVGLIDSLQNKNGNTRSFRPLWGMR